MGHIYDDVFYDYIEHGARASARAILRVLLGATPIRSVLDVGCGRGAWLAEWAAAGTPDVFGVDGAYVDPARLCVPGDRFRALDVGRPFDLGRRFDLVQCLEVGEHLPADRAPVLVANLARHGSLILFSAAVPGQGGESHLNERPPSFWRALLRSEGFSPYDCVRPRLSVGTGVEPWYRFNTLLYARDDAAGGLPPTVSAHRIGDAEPIPDLSPWSWRLRCAALRLLPQEVVTRLAVLKHGAVAALHRL